MFALTLLGAVDVLNSLLELGSRITLTLSLAAAYAIAPGVAAVILARRLWTGGKAVRFTLIALQAWLLIGSVVNLYAGSARGVSQLLLPGALLALVSVGASRTWFELPSEQRAVRPRWTLERLRRDAIPSIPRMIGWWRDRGQSTVEYVGMVGLVALIIGTLLLGGVGTQLSGGLQTAVCNILGGSCESDTVAGDGGDPGGSGSDGGGSDGGGSDGGVVGGGSDGGVVGGGSVGGGSDGGSDSGGAVAGGAVAGGAAAAAGGAAGGGAAAGGAAGGSAAGGGAAAGGAAGGSAAGGGAAAGGAVAGGAVAGGAAAGGGSSGGGSNSGGSDDEASDGGSDGDPDAPDAPEDNETDCLDGSNVAFFGSVTTGRSGSGRYTLASAGVRTPVGAGRVYLSGAALAAAPGTPNPMDLVRSVSGASLPGVGTFQDVKGKFVVAIGLSEPAPPTKPDPEPEPAPEPEPEPAPEPEPEPAPEPGPESEQEQGPNDCAVPNPGKKNPHPEVAVTDVDTSGLPEDVKWRDSDEPLYRFDDRPPDEIFVEDFEPKDPDNSNLWDFTRSNKDSAFVSTTTDDVPDDFYLKKYRYDIDAPGGIDINKTLGDESRYPNENEIAFPGGIQTKYIKGAWELDSNGDPTGEFIENPYYETPEERLED